MSTRSWRRAPRTGLRSAPCAVCAKPRDWLVLGWDEESGRLSSFVGIDAVPADLVQTEFTVVCPLGHALSLVGRTRGQRAEEVLARHPHDAHALVAAWASVAGGKTMIVNRLRCVIVPATLSRLGRRVQVRPGPEVGHVGSVPMPERQIAPPTSAISNASNRRVLETYLRERIDAGTDAGAFLDQLLVAAGASVRTSTGELAADPQWGSRKHPLLAWHEVVVGGRRFDARLWFFDEAGELHERSRAGSSDALVDRRTQRLALSAGEAGVIAWFADVSISRPLLREVRRYPALAEVVRESYRPKVVDGVAQPVDLAVASSERAENSANALNNTARASGRFRVPVGVVVTKLDLVAQVLRRIEDDPERREHPPLRELLGAEWEDALDLAATGLEHLAAYWLDPHRVRLLDGQSRIFLTDHVRNQPDQVRALVEGIVTHFGTSESFWALVNGGREHTFTVRTAVLSRWTIGSIDSYRDGCLDMSGEPARVTMRDLVNNVLGRVLLAADYNADKVDSLCQFVPEQYFLVSLLSDPFVADRRELVRQLTLDDNATTGIKHLFYWLMEPMLRERG